MPTKRLSTRSDPATADRRFMAAAIRLAERGVRNRDGGPFGAVVVLNNRIVGRGWNQVPRSNDPTAHAEIMAIRDACRKLGRFQLDTATLYSTCEPCPMCLGALYWAHIHRLVYAATRRDAARIGFDDEWMYREFELSPGRRRMKSGRILRREALGTFSRWFTDTNRMAY